MRGIVRENIDAQLVGFDDLDPLDAGVVEFVSDYLAFDDPSAYHKPYVRAGHSDGKIRLFRGTGKFPSGYAPMVARALDEELWFPVEIDDRRVAPADLDRHASKTVRDLLTRDPRYAWQLDAIRRVVERERGILWIPTGGGKTEIAVGLAMMLPTRWLFLVKSKDLMHQAAERYESISGQGAGTVGDGVWDDGPGFVAATFQTVSRALRGKDPEKSRRARRLLNQAGGLVVDECHTLPAASFYYVAQRCPAFWRVGLSGTPLARGDRRSVYSVGALGPVIYRIEAGELIRLGVIAAPRIRMLECEQTSDKPTWQGVYGEAVVRSTKRNRLLVEAAVRAEKPALLFVKQEAHGHDLERRLQKAGLQVEFAWGKLKSAARKTLQNRLERRDLDLVVCSVIWQEGLDIPGLRSLIIGTGGKSAIAAIQRVGRGTRIVPGKTDFWVWDVWDRGNKWMAKHSRGRRKAYESEGYEVEVIESQPALAGLG